jgi:hypothetical protein
MKWKKLGKIFDPTKYNLPNNCFEFAQSPQALVFDDFVRIYFSTREKDKTGKYLSHISFVDMDKDLNSITNISGNTVIELGGLGCFDEHGIFPLNVMRAGDKIYGYISGWSRRTSVSVETSIGLAVSGDNGLTFKRIGNGPILTSSLHEPFLVGDPFVCVYENLYHMWYIYGVNWKKQSEDSIPERIYKIGHATSEDGISWHKEGRQLISDKLNSDECQALPSVIKFNNRYHMFFCYRQAVGFRTESDKGYRIGYAFSDDMKNWTRDDDNAGISISRDGWDSDMMCYPHVFHCGDKIYMLYNGNQFGRFGFGLAVLEDAGSDAI